MRDEQEARRPVSYAGASDTGPCEGWQASPSNPTGAGAAREKPALTDTFVFRCTAAEKAALRQKAEAAGVPVATLLREALGRTEARRKPMPRVDPALVLAVGRIGGNLNQIARWLNRAHAAGITSTVDVVEVARRLLSVERQLAQILAQGREC